VKSSHDASDYVARAKPQSQGAEADTGNSMSTRFPDVSRRASWKYQHPLRNQRQLDSIRGSV
jgi:hypothetical protein